MMGTLCVSLYVYRDRRERNPSLSSTTPGKYLSHHRPILLSSIRVRDIILTKYNILELFTNKLLRD